MSLFIFTLVVLFNLWTWSVFKSNFLVGLLVISASVFLYYSNKKNNLKYKVVSLLAFGILAVFQWTVSNNPPLSYLDNDEQRVQVMRLREYPPIKVTLFNKTIWIPIAHWFENRKESIAVFRMFDNFSEAVDPNLYFFANHPRERIGVNEIEKFPYFFFPFFVIGTLLLVQEKKKFILLVSFLIPVVLLTIQGNTSQYSSLAFFPFLVMAITRGLDYGHKLVGRLSYKKRRTIALIFSLFLILNLIQIFSYANI